MDIINKIKQAKSKSDLDRLRLPLVDLMPTFSTEKFQLVQEEFNRQKNKLKRDHAYCVINY